MLPDSGIRLCIVVLAYVSTYFSHQSNAYKQPDMLLNCYFYPLVHKLAANDVATSHTRRLGFLGLCDPRSVVLPVIRALQTGTRSNGSGSGPDQRFTFRTGTRTCGSRPVLLPTSHRPRMGLLQ